MAIGHAYLSGKVQVCAACRKVQNAAIGDPGPLSELDLDHFEERKGGEVCRRYVEACPSNAASTFERQVSTAHASHASESKQEVLASRAHDSPKGGNACERGGAACVDEGLKLVAEGLAVISFRDGKLFDYSVLRKSRARSEHRLRVWVQHTTCTYVYIYMCVRHICLCVYV